MTKIDKKMFEFHIDVEFVRLKRGCSADLCR